MRYARYMMSCVNKPSFSDEKFRVINIGDNIQSLAIDEIYRQLSIDPGQVIKIGRDYISNVPKTEEIILPLHTEFSKESISKRLNYPDNVHVASVISAILYDEIKDLEDEFPNCKKMLESYSPIGCRDERSKMYLEKEGIKAFLMGCFTICFERRTVVPSKKKVFLVDVSENLIKKIPENIMKDAETITHAIKANKYPIDREENERLDLIAQNLLKRYRDEATLVITGRLHAAVPCIAMGIPVILACDSLDFRFEWIEKLIKPYQLLDYDNIDWNPEAINIEDVKKVMLQFFNKILNNESGESELKWLDEFYSNRSKIEPYQGIRMSLSVLKNYFHENSFKYAIWGAGYHAGFVKTLMDELYPEAELACVIDRFKNGEFNGKTIMKTPDKKTIFDCLLITSTPGTNDALRWISNNMGIPYVIVASQQKS